MKGVIWSLEPYKIYTPQDLTVTRPKEKYVYFLNTNGKPLWGVPFNDTLVVAGTKFFPSRGKVRITINDSLFVAEAVVADDSMFHVIVPPLPYGLKSIRIRVCQADQAVIHILPVFRQGDAMEDPGKERR